MIYPAPKPKSKKRVRVSLKHGKPLPSGKRIKQRNAKRKGRAFGASRVDEAYLTWLRGMPCALHAAWMRPQVTPTEVEHFVPKSHGGYDRGDTYPTCGECREMRHVTMGPKAFSRMLLRFGMDERALCDRLATMYEAEKFPCP